MTCTVTAPTPSHSVNVSPTSATVGQTVTATPSNADGLQLDWGDGSPRVTVSTAPLTHSYATAGTYMVRLFKETTPLDAPVVVVVSTPALTLSVTPSSGLIGATFTATLGNLVSGVSYTLDWADGTSENVTGIGTVTRTHVYSAAGTYAVKVSAPGVVPAVSTVTISRPAVTFGVTPGSAAVGATFTASFASLDPAASYSLNWGDSSTDTVSGQTSGTRTHVYAAPGTFSVTFTPPGAAPTVVPVTVTFPTPTLNVSPASGTVGQTFTATVGNTVSGVSYTLDWADGTTQTVTANGTQTHSYAAAGTYAVKLSAPGLAPVVAPVTVSNPAPTLGVSPGTAAVGETFTATLGNLVSGVSYTLDWGDSATDTVTGSGTATRTHSYSAPGTYPLRFSERGGPPAVASAVVTPPAVTLSVTPASLPVGGSVTASVGRTLPNLSYTLDWGDGTTQMLGGSASYTQAHTYPAPGTFVVRVSASGVAPATAAVSVSAQTPTLTLTPSPAYVGQSVSAAFSSLTPSQGYTLDWGDGSAPEGFQGSSPAPRNHTYVSAGTFQVKVITPGAAPVVAPLVVGYGCEVFQNTGTVQTGVSATFTLTGKSDGKSGYVGFPAGTPYTLDWGDGTPQTSGTGAGTPLPLTHTYGNVGPFVIKATVAGSTPCILAVTVGLPPATLNVDAQRAGTPSTVSLTGLVNSAALSYLLDFGDGLTQLVTAAQPNVPHVYQQSGTYSVRLLLQNAGSPPTLLAAGVAVIGSSTGNLSLKTEIRASDKVGQPLPTSGVAAPTSAEIGAGVQAASVVTLTAQGSGTVNIRWTWTATSPTPGATADTVLDSRTVSLAAGPNPLTLTLPTNVNGLYTLKVEVLGNPSDPKLATPLVTVQSVSIKATPPKVLVIGSGDNQFRFLVTQVIYRADVIKMPGGGAIDYDSVPISYDPNNFWALLTPETPVNIGALSVPLTVQLAQKLKITQDGETATLVSGLVIATTTPTTMAQGGSPSVTKISGGITTTTQADTKNPAFSLPALFPMQLKIGTVQFGVDGAFMVNPLLTSPDYSQTPVAKFLYFLLEKYIQTQTKDPRDNPGGPVEDMANILFSPVMTWSAGPGGVGGQQGTPVLSPIMTPGGSRGNEGRLLAQGRGGAATSELLAQANAALKFPTNLTATGSGYGTFKGAALLNAAAGRGVQNDYGVFLKDGTRLTDTSVTANGARVISKNGGRFDLPAFLGGAVDVAALDLILGKGQRDFLNFPRLELDNHGFVASTRTVGGVSVASWPTAYGLAGGTQRLGSDSGVSVDLPGNEPQPIYLDLNPTLSVQPDGYGAAALTARGSQGGLSAALRTALSGPAADQASLLRQTYSGAPDLVSVPDVGPGWQGLLWIADNVQADSVLNANPQNPEAGQPVKFSAPLKVAAPVSFGLGGWNFNIDGDLAQGGGSSSPDGFTYKTDHIIIAMVRSNLIRSEQTGVVRLPFLGGSPIRVRIIGNTVTAEKSVVTRGYGPDGSFTSSSISYSVATVKGSNQKVGTYHVGGVFDLTRVSPGLKLGCSSLEITPNLDALPASNCNFAALKGNRTFAGTLFSVDNAALQKTDAQNGTLTLTGSALVGDTGGNGAVTAPGSSFNMKASADDYRLTLVTGDIAQQVQNGTDNGLKMTFKGNTTDLTGSGVATIGAGEGAGYANNELSFDTGSLRVSDSIEMKVKGLFGRNSGKSYWYVLASGSINPCIGVIPKTFEVCQVYGGLAYNMNWKQADGSLVQFSSLKSRPLPDSGLHMALGVVGDIIDKQTANVAGIVVINPQQLSLDFGGDLYLFKPYAQGKPQARFGGTLGKSGFFLSACVGPAAPLPGSKLNCSNLEALSLVDVLYVTGRADLSVGYGGKTYFYLGTYKAPILATVDLRILKINANSYVMTGQLDGQGLPPIPGLAPGIGVAAGAALDYTYHEAGSDSVLFCDVSWHFDAHLYAGVDAVFTVSPLQLGGDMQLGASASVGGSLCGVGGSVGAGIDLSATFLLNKDYGYVDGNAHVTVSLPVVNDVDTDFPVRITVYGTRP